MEPTCRLSDKNKRLRWKKQTDAPWSAGPHVHQDLMSNIIVLLGSIRVKMNANEMENGEGSGAYHRGLWQTRVGSSEAPENSNWLQHREGGRGGCLHRYSDDPALMQVAAAVRAPTRVCACLS